MVLEVSLIVLLPPPYGPPGVLLPGLVTVTATMPAAAMAEAGIATVSWFMAGWAVLVCAIPFQFTTAFTVKAVAVDRQGESWIAVIRSVGDDGCYDRNNSGLRGCSLWGAIPTPKGQYREQKHRGCLHNLTPFGSSLTGSFIKRQTSECQALVMVL